MNIFPSETYEFKLIDEQSETLQRLKRRTEDSDNLISKITDKTFIGKIDNNKFRIISSNIGKGAFITMIGFISYEKGEVKLEVNKPFRILIYILMIFPFIALLIQLFDTSQEFNPIFILVCIVQVLVIRFLFVSIYFRAMSKSSLNRLADVLDTEWIKKKV